MGNFISGSKRKIFIVVLLALIVIAGYKIYSYIVISSYKSIITVEQIPEVLRVETDPYLPTKWEVESIEKYDDGFTHPFVTIKYKNKIRLQLYKNRFNYSNEFKDKKELNIGGKKVDYYSNKKKVAYVFFSSNINYGIISPKDFQRDVERFLETLILSGI